MFPENDPLSTEIVCVLLVVRDVPIFVQGRTSVLNVFSCSLLAITHNNICLIRQLKHQTKDIVDNGFLKIFEIMC